MTGCPFHDDNRDSEEESASDEGSRGIERRSFLRSALVIGGTSALSTTVSLYGMPDAAAAASEPPGVVERANRQHAWDAYEAFDEEHEQSLTPAHALVLHVDYHRPGKPAPADRREVARTLDRLERAFEWSHEGVLFTVGYSVDYFEDRFAHPFNEDAPTGTIPAGVNPTNTPKPGLLDPKDLIDTPGVTLDREDPEADRYDAVIHLASDHVQNLLAAEEALWGFPDDPDRNELNGVDFGTANFDGIFTKPTSFPARRTGVAGHENVADSLDAATDFDTERLHDDAELSMGFNDLYRNSVPGETNVTLLEDQRLVEPKPPGQFAQGTVMHVSSLDVNLAEESGNRDGGWYDDFDLTERRERMFSPHHTMDNTGEVGENLGNSNAPGDMPMRDLSRTERTADEDRTIDDRVADDEEDAGTDESDRKLDAAERVEKDAAEHGVVGHAQKLARARFDLEDRVTVPGEERLDAGGYDPNPTEERGDGLDGHDAVQTAEQVVLRRDLVSTDRKRPGNLFVALMRFNPYMVYIRRAMNGVDFDTSTFGLPTGEGEPGFVHNARSELPDEDSGILDYVTTKRRGNYLVPPITLRSLPYPDAVDADLDVRRDGDRFVVRVDLDPTDVEDDYRSSPERLDLETTRFGYYRAVNRGAGADPVTAEWRESRYVVEFPTADTELLRDDRSRARLFGKLEGTRKPVFATVDLDD